MTPTPESPSNGTPINSSPINGTPINGTDPHVDALRLENSQLRYALTSRAVIDQAKGMIMAERHCDADQAFQVLRELSQDTNVPVREVARALVYQATPARSAHPRHAWPVD